MSVAEKTLAVIGTGEENAVSLEQLINVTGLPNRDVRKLIESLRRSGHIIISSNAGYFYPETVEELMKYIRKERSRARSILRTLHSARELLADWGDTP